jgi:cytochrome c-type biogenesis protein CcmH/NrfG
LRSLSEIYSELGHTLLNAGRHAEAAQAFRDAIRARPDSAELQLYLAQANEAQKHFDDALHAYLEAVRLSPDDALEVLPQVHTLLTRELAKPLGKRLESIRRSVLDKPDLGPETRAAVWLFFGRVNLYHNNFRQALADFQVALANKPDDVFSLEGMGEALWREGQTSAAVRDLEEGCQLCRPG